MMQIDKNKVVSLVYELREAGPGGRIIEALEEERPMTFIYGSGRLLPRFELNIQSLGTDDRFNFVLKSEDAYGERLEDMIINVPLSVFEADGKVDENVCQVGNEVPMMDREGNRISGIINEITKAYVRMDFNHPMAGTDLWFSGKILDVHEATEEELNGASGCSGCSDNSSRGCSGCSQ
jgi:FKBP-type peptidyl-prolyl cis-trans isomerase SlyD